MVDSAFLNRIMGGLMWRRLGLPILLLLVLLAGCVSLDKTRTDYVFQEVLYLTTREDTGAADPDKRFGTGRGEPGFGAAMVAIDPREVFSSFAEPQANRVVQQAELLRAHPLQQVRTLAEAEFRESLRGYAAGPGAPPEVLLFIHGYKRGFDDCVANAARLRHQLAFAGPVIAFAWPSTESVSGYLADIENLDWSLPQLHDLVATVVRELPGSRIHLMAHSLGNRALVELLSGMLRSGSPGTAWPFGEIVLIAPDLDRDMFIKEVATRFRAIPSRKTLYVSAKDFPLMASAQVFQYPRLGDARTGVPVLEGFETIDVSDAITILNGHGYYEADRATIEDLYRLLREGKGAPERAGLVPVDSEEGTYWRLLPVEAEAVAPADAGRSGRRRG